MFKKYKLNFVLSLLLILGQFWFLTSCVKQDTQQDKELVMGFVPLQDSEKLIHDVKPLEEALSTILKRPVKSFVASNYVGVVAGLNTNKVNFAFLPPFAYILAKHDSGVKSVLQALNKHNKSSYTSSIYVKKDSDIKNISDLKNKKIAFVDLSSSSGYIFPAALLKKEGLRADVDYQQILSGGHDKSLQALLNNDVDAACVFTEAPERYSKDFPQLTTDLRELVRTEDIPGVSVVCSAATEDNDAKLIAGALQTLAATDDGKKLLSSLFSIYGFVPADESNYAIVEEAASYLDIDLSKLG